ncbi:hypothetical protein [Streptomyces sp. NPDC007856]|uniref:hypothetical protein n=1 Tax=Streptomyces sp. NPDC007856 TaxID=3364781 RepID=UPI0036C04161
MSIGRRAAWLRRRFGFVRRAEQDAGLGDPFGGQGERTAADAASGAAGVEAFAGAFDDLLTLELGDGGPPRTTGVTLRPKPAPIRQRSEPETPEEAELHDRLQAQVLQRRAGQ